MAEDTVIANRRLKICIAWPVFAALMIVAQKIFALDLALVNSLLEKSGTIALVAIGGLSATDAAFAFSSKKGAEK